jgi:YEATS domain-containing protein 4
MMKYLHNFLGSIAFYLGKKAQEYQTHRWTLYIRGPQDEDLSAFISKVSFTLHPSFAQPIRIVEKRPFQISESGWGEFEAGIRIYFKDPTEEPVDLFHHLRLYPPSTQQQLNVKKPVVSEAYDEIVFVDPSRLFFQQLMNFGPVHHSSMNNNNNNSNENQHQLSNNNNNNNSSSSASRHHTVTAWPEHYLTFDDSFDTETLLQIQQFLRREISGKQCINNIILILI